MSSALPYLVSTKLRFTPALPSLVEGSKFIKWINTDENNYNNNNNSFPAIGVDFYSDPKNFILYWRDFSKKKSEYLEISSIRDVKTGPFAYVPSDKVD